MFGQISRHHDPVKLMLGTMISSSWHIKLTITADTCPIMLRLHLLPSLSFPLCPVKTQGGRISAPRWIWRPKCKKTILRVCRLNSQYEDPQIPKSYLLLEFHLKNRIGLSFPGGSVVKNLPANVGAIGSIPGLGGSHMLWGNCILMPQQLSLHCN